MQEVTVTKEELLKTLRDNRTAHIQLYKDAVEGFKVESKKKLEKALASLDKGTMPKSMSFHPPVDHTEQYDEAIKMLEMSVDTNITLSRHEFTQYVQDSWISQSERMMMRSMALSSSNSNLYQ